MSNKQIFGYGIAAAVGGFLGFFFTYQRCIETMYLPATPEEGELLRNTPRGGLTLSLRVPRR